MVRPWPSSFGLKPIDLPRSFLRTRVKQWTFFFVLVCLGHMYMENRTCKFLSDSGAPTVIIRRNPNSGPPRIYPRSFLRTRVKQWTFFFLLVCLGHMYMENHTCKFFSESGTPTVIIRRNPNSGPPQIYPRSFLRTRVKQWTFLFVLFCLCHM